MRNTSIFAATLTGALLSSAAAAAPSTTELYEIIQAQQEQIDALGTRSSTGNNVHIGGYGELHFNNVEVKDGVSDSKDADEIDFHRFVLFFGYDFSDSIRFRSEFELEHALAGDGKPGEVELEQAYIEFDLDEDSTAKAGVFLVPVGILNETHEPPTFYGVERNGVEKNIIPSTWWEAGAAYSSRFSDSLSYDVAIHSGLALDTTTAGKEYIIRGGRQKVAEATADDFAVTARIKYTGIAGVELASTVQHQFNATQGADADASATLIEAHAAVSKGNFGVRALIANWSIDGAAAEALGRDQQIGYYLEGSVKASEKTGLFARASQWDNTAGNSTDTETTQLDIGANYWPIEDVVLKFDVFTQETAGVDTEGFNLGVGYQF